MTESKAAEVVVYVPNEATLVEAADKARGLKIAGIEDRKGYALVHEKRMELKGFRVEIEKTRKQLKADALEYGRRVDHEAKRLTALVEPVERELEAEEERIDAEKARIAAEEEAARRKVLDDRMAALAAVGCQAVPSEIEDMGEHEFAATLKIATEAHEEKLEAERVAAAERARVAAEEAAARKAEQERQAAERVRMEQEEAARRAEEQRQQQAERERLAAERADLERQQAAQRAQADQLARERKEIEASQRAEAEQLARERAAFQAEQERVTYERRIEEVRKEAAEQARIESEAATQRAKAEAEERARREAEEAARREAMRPEVERVRAFAESLLALDIPKVWCESAIRGALTYASRQVLALAEIDP